MKIFLKKRRYFRKIIIAVLVFAAVIFILNFFQGQIRNSFYFVSSPVQRFLWKIGDSASGFFVSFLDVAKLKKDFNNLSLKNQELLSEIAALKELKSENEKLRSALGVELQKDFELSFCQIIGKDVYRDTILINKGRKDGVSENMPVVTEQKVVAGRVSEVLDNFSKIMLLGNKDSFFDAKIQEKNIEGIVRGEGGSKIIFDLVPRDQDVIQGDGVVTSSLGGIFPPGLLIGEVVQAKKSDTEPIQNIEIRPYFDLGRTEDLFLITGY